MISKAGRGAAQGIGWTSPGWTVPNPSRSGAATAEPGVGRGTGLIRSDRLQPRWVMVAIVARLLIVRGWQRVSAAFARLLKIVGLRRSNEGAISGETVQQLMREGTRAGVFDPAEQEMVKRVLRFGRRRARELMTPRDEILWIDTTDTPEEIRRKVIGSPHSRFPVCDEVLDNLVGVVHVKDLFGHAPSDQPFRIQGCLTLPALLYEGTRGLKILEILRASGTHTAIVLDEFGTVRGLLTLTDLLQAILGDLSDRPDDEPPRAARQPDGSWLLDGRLPIDEAYDLLGRPDLPQGDFHTIAGLVVVHLGRIPAQGETFEAWGLRFEVMERVGNRIDRLRIAGIDRPGAPSDRRPEDAPAGSDQ